MSTPSQTGQPQHPGFAGAPGFAPGAQGPAAGAQPGAVPGQPGPGFGAPPNAGQQGFAPQPGQAPGQAPGQPGFAPNGGQQFAPAPGMAGPNPFPQAKATFGTSLRSEWTKIRTVRSTFWTLLITMVITIGLSGLFSFGATQHVGEVDRATSDWTANSMSGLFLGQLVIVVFGAMAITAEYSTGMIRTSLTSLPRRGTLFSAKFAIVALVSLAVGLICSFASFFIGSAIYSGKDIHISLSDPGVLRAVFGGGLYLAVSALLAFGLGAILRHTAGAITSAVGLLFVLMILSQFLPGSWRDNVSKWVPFNAGLQIITTRPQDHMLSPWAGFAVFSLYAAIAVVGGAIVMRSKDA